MRVLQIPKIRPSPRRHPRLPRAARPNLRPSRDRCAKLSRERSGGVRIPEHAAWHLLLPLHPPRDLPTLLFAASRTHDSARGRALNPGGLCADKQRHERPASPSLHGPLGQPHAGTARASSDRPATLWTLRPQAGAIRARREHLSLQSLAAGLRLAGEGDPPGARPLALARRPSRDGAGRGHAPIRPSADRVEADRVGARRARRLGVGRLCRERSRRGGPRGAVRRRASTAHVRHLG